MSLIHPKGGKTWRYEFVFNGLQTGNTGVAIRGEKPPRGERGTPEYEASRAEAKKVENRRRAELAAAAREVEKVEDAQRVLGIDPKTAPDPIPTLKEAATAYWAARGRHTANAAADKRNLFRLLEIVGPDKLVIKIGNADVERLVNTRRAEPRLSKPTRCRETGVMLPGVPQVEGITGEPCAFEAGIDDPDDIIRVKASTVNRQTIDLLKRVMLYARDTLSVPGMPGINWRKYRLKEPKARERTLSFEEEARITPFLRVGYGAAFEFALKAALRLENFVGLRWRDVNFSAGTITVVQKGDREHTVRITPVIRAILDEQKGRDPVHVFVFEYEGRGDDPKPWKNPKNGVTYVPGQVYPVTYWGFSSWFRAVRKKTDIRDLTIHDLRRTAITRVIEAVGDPKVAQHLAGHDSVHLTMTVYNQVTKKSAHARLDEAERIIAEKRAKALRTVEGS